MSILEPQEPTVTQTRLGQCDPADIFNHPAYGVVTLGTPTGGDRTLFGSDVGHGQRMRITVHRAELKRDLSHDWIHPTDYLIEFEMSHAQFAQFITSPGKGCGTPVTLRSIAGQGHIPGIKNVETKHETFRKEIRTAAANRLDALAKQVDRLKVMLAGGKISKRDLADVANELQRHVEQTPGSLEFVVKSAEEALEKATSDAKIEVESYIQMSARRIGLERIEDLARLENRSGDVNGS